MYYYIFEPPQNQKDFERASQIKELLATLGIAGEMALPSPGKGVLDLVNTAVSKRYSTIVAVGGMNLINQVALAIGSYDIALGIIPLEVHPDIVRLLGTNDWKIAAEQLKRRRWEPVRLGIINDAYSFITPATIQLEAGVGFAVVADGYHIESRGGIITVIPFAGGNGQDFLVEINQANLKKSGVFSRIFSKAALTQDRTLLPLRRFKIITAEEHPLTVAGVEICKTPIACKARAGVIKVIVAKRAV